jgi:hypothetical protein
MEEMVSRYKGYNTVMIGLDISLHVVLTSLVDGAALIFTPAE